MPEGSYRVQSPGFPKIVYSLRPREPEGSLGRTAQDGHLDSHTAPELFYTVDTGILFIVWDS